MQPKIEFLSPELIDQILGEAFQLLTGTGVKVLLPAARTLLIEAGAKVDADNEVVHIPEDVARKAMETVPNEFWLHDRHGKPTVHYGGDSVHFDPGSSGVNMLDPETGQRLGQEVLKQRRVIP